MGAAVSSSVVGVGFDLAALQSYAKAGVKIEAAATTVQSMDVDDDGDNKPASVALGPVQMTEQWMQTLQTFMESLPGQLLQLRATMTRLDEKRQTELAKCKTRDQEQELIRRIDTLQEYLHASCRQIQSRVDERVLVERMRDMMQFFSRIPAAEKNQRSLMDSWFAMFDVNSVVPRQLAKDHCDVCKRPLLHSRKQSLLICTACARVTEHLTPIAQGGTWMKNSLAAQPENKRIRSVIVKLTQFRVGTPPIPPEVPLAVRHWLKARNHLSQDAPALSTPVTAALRALGYERYVPYSAKIANLVNGFDVATVTDEQINEIVARLRAIQACFAFLQGRVERLTFHSNFFVGTICRMRGWHQLAACFPPQRTRKLLADQVRLWRHLVSYLKVCDPSHAW